MAEELNMHFSSVFMREDTSSLPVPETKFNGSEGERLGQLVVTPEVVASKINNMKENKSPGVDGISLQILKETVEQMSTPLAHVFNMSLQEGIVPLEWKEANMGQHYSLKEKNQDKEIQQRITAGWAAYAKHRDIFKSNLAICLKRQVYNSCVLPAMSYDIWCIDLDTDQTSTEQTCGRTDQNGQKYAQHHIQR